MGAFDRVLAVIKQALLLTEDIRRLSDGVKALGAEVRDLDRRVARLEGVVVGQAQRAPTRKRISKKDD